jgi:hypothetical protein
MARRRAFSIGATGSSVPAAVAARSKYAGSSVSLRRDPYSVSAPVTAGAEFSEDLFVKVHGLADRNDRYILRQYRPSA